MISLAQVIATLQRELADAQQKQLASGLQVSPDSLVATLHFKITKTSDDTSPLLDFDCSSGCCTNSIQIELRTTAPNNQATLAIAPSESRRSEIPAADVSSIEEKLSEVFGKPGFDSSARATVFREALENLSTDELRDLIEILGGNQIESSRISVKHSASMISRVCQSGPSGSTGKEILASLFQIYDVDPLIRLVARVWKSQQDWL